MHLQCIFIGFTTLFIVGLQNNFIEAASIPSKKPLSIRAQQCREGCLEKFAIKESLCQQRPECSTNGFPPYNYNSLPDALHLLCWDECAKPPPPKLNKSIRETWALRTVSMLQQDSLVLVDVTWAPLNTPNQCLVTWEVSGGGLMGNLLTETFNVQLSLWPDTKYRVQVTCKNKLTESMSRSLPLNIDTSEAITTSLPSIQSKTEHPFRISSPAPISVASVPIIIDNQLSTSLEDQSNESINHHTNFIFNWHRGTTTTTTTSDDDKIISNSNSDNNSQNDIQVNRVDNLNQSELNIMAIAAISDMEKPLLFGFIAGTLLLMVVLFLYIFVLRSQRVPNDKASLIENDGCVVTSTSTSTTLPTDIISSGGCPSVSLNPAYYARTVHVLTV